MEVYKDSIQQLLGRHPLQKPNFFFFCGNQHATDAVHLNHIKSITVFNHSFNQRNLQSHSWKHRLYPKSPHMPLNSWGSRSFPVIIFQFFNFITAGIKDKEHTLKLYIPLSTSL